MGKTFEIALEALGSDGTDVPLDAFNKSLESIGKFLRAIDEDLNGKAQVEWLIGDLHHSKPTVVLEGRSGSTGATPDAIIASGFQSLERLAGGQDDPFLSDQALKALKATVAPFGKTLRAIHLKSEDSETTLDLNFAATFGAIKFESEQFYEEWQGSLDEINFHAMTPTFRLYPLLVPRFITCEFDLSDKVKMLEATERKVSVFGEAIYRPNAKYPSKIRVKDVDVIDDHPEDLAGLVFAGAGRENYRKQLSNLIESRDDWG